MDELQQVSVDTLTPEEKTAWESAVAANRAVVNSGGFDFDAALGGVVVETLLSMAMAGFSYGFQLNIKGIRFGFSRLHYAVGVTPNCFDFAFNFDELAKNSKERKTRKLERITP